LRQGTRPISHHAKQLEQMRSQFGRARITLDLRLKLLELVPQRPGFMFHSPCSTPPFGEKKCPIRKKKWQLPVFEKPPKKCCHIL
jgi:hypothetical protein